MSFGRAGLLLVIAGTVGLGGAAGAAASTGVSIDVGRIDVRDELAPGGDYRLPSFAVRNPGGQPTSYRLVVNFVDGQEAHQPAADWFHFEPAELALGPGEARPVNVRLVLPPDAEEGAYAALIGPQIALPGGGAQVGAAAAARLTFRVGRCDGLDCWLRWLGRWLAANPWVLILSTALVALAVLWLLRRRFSITITRRA